jgi:Uma2 family endonuclease
VTAEEYLEIDRAAECRSEYLDGQMYAMVGSTRTNSFLAGAIGSELYRALRGRRCGVAICNLRVGVSARVRISIRMQWFLVVTPRPPGRTISRSIRH